MTTEEEVRVLRARVDHMETLIAQIIGTTAALPGMPGMQAFSRWQGFRAAQGEVALGRTVTDETIALYAREGAEMEVRIREAMTWKPSGPSAKKR